MIQNLKFTRLFMQLYWKQHYSFHGAHPTHVSSLVDMQLIPPNRFWYLYGSGSFTMSIIIMPTKDDTSYDLLWKAEGCACKESLTQDLERRMSG